MASIYEIYNEDNNYFCYNIKFRYHRARFLWYKKNYRYIILPTHLAENKNQENSLMKINTQWMNPDHINAHFLHIDAKTIEGGTYALQ